MIYCFNIHRETFIKAVHYESGKDSRPLCVHVWFKVTDSLRGGWECPLLLRFQYVLVLGNLTIIVTCFVQEIFKIFMVSILKKYCLKAEVSFAKYQNWFRFCDEIIFLPPECVLFKNFKEITSRKVVLEFRNHFFVGDDKRERQNFEMWRMKLRYA